LEVIPLAQSCDIKCSICDEPLTLKTGTTDDAGNPVHDNCYVGLLYPNPTNILDYPSMMSGYEKESRWAEAKLAADKAKKRRQSA
jgi:hypothetical protein